MELLLDEGNGQINALDGERNTPLHLAILRGNVEQVSMILRVGVEINVDRKCDGSYPIHAIATLSSMPNMSSSCVDMLTALSSHPNFNVNLKDDSYHTALYTACKGSCVPLVRKLLELATRAATLATVWPAPFVRDGSAIDGLNGLDGHDGRRSHEDYTSPATTIFLLLLLHAATRRGSGNSARGGCRRRRRRAVVATYG